MLDTYSRKALYFLCFQLVTQLLDFIGNLMSRGEIAYPIIMPAFNNWSTHETT